MRGLRARHSVEGAAWARIEFLFREPTLLAVWVGRRRVRGFPPELAHVAGFVKRVRSVTYYFQRLPWHSPHDCSYPSPICRRGP